MSLGLVPFDLTICTEIYILCYCNICPFAASGKRTIARGSADFVYLLTQWRCSKLTEQMHHGAYILSGLTCDTSCFPVTQQRLPMFVESKAHGVREKTEP